MRNQVQLITYADRLAGDLPGLARLLDGPLDGLFGGVHVLPFYLPFDGADAGFDPDDHTSVDPRLGTWDDLRRVGAAAGGDLMADVIVNHVSSRSPQFTDWLARGPASEAAGMFLTWDHVFPAGADEATLLRIYRPRPGLPVTPYVLADGSRRLVWTTFTGQQVDLDVEHPATRAYLGRVLDQLAAAGVTAVRLDAVGYAVKTPGTSCFMTPETFGFIDELTGWCRDRGLEVLVEVHSHYQRQVEIARQVDLVYDFALPPLVLWALHAGDAAPLRDWLLVRPSNCVTVLDTHDGIGVVDVGADPDDRARAGLLTPDQIDHLVTAIHTASHGASQLATGAAASNVDLYQVNCTYYDALGANADRYLLARALQFLVPGVPQVYYVGLLAGRNDVELLQRTGVGRDINRHHYSAAEVADALADPVVRALTALVRLRSHHPAFAGAFTLGGEGPVLDLEWHQGAHQVLLVADVADASTASLEWTDPDGLHRVDRLLDLGLGS